MQVEIVDQDLDLDKPLYQHSHTEAMVPRVGEVVFWQGKTYDVVEVRHQFKILTVTVYVSKKAYGG